MLDNLPEADEEFELTKRILDHWDTEIGLALLEKEPFDHFYLDNIWPRDIFDKILVSFPPREQYVPINIKQWVRANGESTRDRILLTEENIAKFGSPISDFWKALTSALYSDELKKLVFTKLKSDLSLRLGVPEEDVPDVDVLVGASLTRDSEEYKIKPHPDGYPRAATMQFYFPSDRNQLDLGTSLYVKKSNLPFGIGRKYQEVKRLLFQPNSGYAFAVNDRKERCSLHGRELISAASGIRHSLLVSWYIEEPNSNKSSAAQVVPTRRVGH